MATSLNFYPLVSNIDTLKDRYDEKGKTLQSKDSEITVAVQVSDLLSGVESPIFYASRYGMVYNPEEEFKPNIAGNHAIKGRLIDDYRDMLPKARDEYKRLLNVFKGRSNSGEIDELKKEIAQKEIRIKEQAARIQELSEKTPQKGEHIERLEQMIKIQTAALKTLTDTLQKNRIEIKIGDKTTKNVEKVVHENFVDIITLLAKDQAVYMYGPAGTGKSQLAQDIAETLELKFCPMSALTQEFKLSGFIDAGGKYHETNFYRAFVHGGLFFLDEMDACDKDVLVGLNGALANGYYDFPTGTEFAHENFRVIAAGNTIGRGGDMIYTGRQVLDMSTLDRFWGVEVDYSILIDNAVSNEDIELVEFAQAVRKAAAELDVHILLSYRSISRIANFQDTFPLVKIMKMAVIKGIASDDIRMLARNMPIDSNNKYYQALKEAA